MERNIATHTENVVLIEQGGKLIGFIKNPNGAPAPTVYACGLMGTEEIAQLIDPEHGAIMRGARPKAEPGA